MRVKWVKRSRGVDFVSKR